jgi:acetate kinase
LNVLIFNCGSSSQSFKIYRTDAVDEPMIIASGKARNVATKTKANPILEWEINGKAGSLTAQLSTHRMAAEQIIAVLNENHLQVDVVGHRFVNGGPLFKHTTEIDKLAMQNLKQGLHFAPIHNPNSYSVIEVCQKLLPGIPQYAVFDTAFHAEMPEAAQHYAIPRELAEKFGFRKYGYHGLSYQYVSFRIAQLIGKQLTALKLIICHLGTGGSSVVAVKDGKSQDTSMGFSPLPGLVMSTRCGDIDAEIVLELIRNGYSAEQVGSILNNQSGLIGLSGFSSNLQEVIEEAEKGNVNCRLAYDVYCRRLQFYLGAYTWLLGVADAIVFTDDVGTKCWQLRERVCADVHNLGVVIDPQANRCTNEQKSSRISSEISKTQIWVVPTDEEIIILQEVLAQFSPNPIS